MTAYFRNSINSLSSVAIKKEMVGKENIICLSKAFIAIELLKWVF